MEAYAQYLQEIDGGRVLDVATGGGAFLKLIVNSLKSYEYARGIDIDEQTIKKAGELNKNKKLSFMCMSGENIEYPDGYFNTACLSNALHHLSNIDATIEQMLRVLHPSGTIIINELFCDGLNDRQMVHVQIHDWIAKVNTAVGVTHGKTLSKSQIAAILERHGIYKYESFIHRNDLPNKEMPIDMLEKRWTALLNRAKGHPQYTELASELRTLLGIVNEVGFERADELMIVANKSAMND